MLLRGSGLKAQGAAGAKRISTLATAVADKLSRPAPAVDGGSRYAGSWNPPNVERAIAQIYNTTDFASFEAGGRLDYGRLEPYLRPSDCVLDLGCGIGRVAFYVAERCRALWAVDVSPRMLELCEERLHGWDKVRYALCKDVEIPDVPSGSVDFAYSLLVLQHLEREDAFLLLEELRRVLRPAGRAYLTFPNLLSDTYLECFVTYAHSRASGQLERARLYTPQEVERLLPAAGFKVLSVEVETEIRALVEAV